MIEVVAVQTARLIIHLPTDELNPRGRAILPDITTALVERYGFLNYPQKYEDYDDQKGISFELGKWNNIGLNRLAIYNTGLLCDTSSSTDDCEAFLKDALTWAAESFGLTYHSDMLNRRVYLSELIVKQDRPLAALNPKLDALATKLSNRVSEIMGRSATFEVVSVAFNQDQFFSKNTLAGFRFERMADIPFSENRYYTAASLPTEEHIVFLNEFDAALNG